MDKIDVNILHDSGGGFLVHSFFTAEQAKGKHPFVYKFTRVLSEQASKRTYKDDAKAFKCELVSFIDGSSSDQVRQAFFQNENCLIYFVCSRYNGKEDASFALAADSVENLDSLITIVERTYPKDVHKTEPEKVRTNFWSQGRNGPNRNARDLSVPNWESVSPNYEPKTKEHIAKLASDAFVPGNGGKLLLFHGLPGTGKTWSLRALTWEWRKWCDFHYITDPDAFFASSSYMLDVLLDSNDWDSKSTLIDHDDELEEEDRWKLLILEDTGELMSADAGDRSGQGLSRLLNTVDGMIGQGINVLILVTTNERIQDLHAAVRRPGRCAASIEFELFERDDAQKWLNERSDDATKLASGEYAVADLYSILAGSETSEERSKEHKGAFGFGA